MMLLERAMPLAAMTLFGLMAVVQPGHAQSAAARAATAPGRPQPVVVGAELQGLDKLVGRVHAFDALLNKEVRLGTLGIVVRACVPSAPEAPPEAAAFLEITETKPGEESRRIFSGWMFASSPALSALEHPVYDVWVVGCKTTESAASPKSR